MRNEMRNKMRNEMRNELRNEMRNEMRNRIRLEKRRRRRRRNRKGRKGKGREEIEKKDSTTQKSHSRRHETDINQKVKGKGVEIIRCGVGSVRFGS
jgi:hypothetical protein